MSKVIKKERTSNFELMRIISMLFIVMYHVIVHGKISTEAVGSYKFIINFILSILIVHVNSLVFLTGYFSCNKNETKYKKVGKIIGKAWFYKAIIVILFFIFGVFPLTKIKIMEELLPLDLGNYWYINCYLILIILIPYLNEVIKRMNKKQFGKFIIILILLLSIIPTATNCRVLYNDGFSIINFVLVYYIGAYFRKFPLKDNYHFKNMSKKEIQFLLLATLIIVQIINFSFNNIGQNMMSYDSNILCYFGKIITDGFLRYSNPLVIIQTCAYCLLFETLNIKSNIINKISMTTLGIYLIHDNALVRQWLYIFLKTRICNTILNSLILILLDTLIIFSVSMLIESIRIKLASVILKIISKLKEKVKLKNTHCNRK